MIDAYADQEFLYDPDAGVVGDCWRACIANLTGRPLAQVPHFVRDYGDEWLTQTALWVRAEIGMELKVDTDPRFPFAPGDSALVIFAGPSPRGVLHGVLGDRDGNTVHDPHPSRAGVLSIEGVFFLAAPS